MTLYGMPDISQPHARADQLNPLDHALMTDPTQAFCLHGGWAHVEHHAGVAMIPVLDDGDVDIDDIAVFEHPFSRYTVADLVVHRGADRLGKTLIVEGGRYGVLGID